MNMRGMTGKWNAMWHSSPSPKYSTTSAGHWLASASRTRSGYSSSTVARTRLRNSCVSGQVLAVRALALEEVGHGVEAEAVEAEVEPEAQRVEHRLLDLGVVVVEVGLVAEEAVPVVGAGLLVPRPVRRLGVGEDDPRVLVALSACPTRRTSRAWGCPGSTAPPGTTGGREEVWFITRSAMTRMPRWWAASMNSRTSSIVAVVGVDLSS